MIVRNMELYENKLCISRRMFFRVQGKKRRRCGHRRGFLTQQSGKEASELYNLLNYSSYAVAYPVLPKKAVYIR